jgi:ADP-heptose:LPS heptosyltransferase
MSGTELFGSPDRILVVKAAGIGDLILAVPALRALRTRFPGAAIDLLVTPKCADLLKYCPYINQVHVIQTRGMQNRVSMSDLLTLMKTLGALRKTRYDMLINLYHLFSDRGARRMKALCKTIRPRCTIGRNTDGRGAFYDAWIPDSWGREPFAGRHEVLLNLEVVRILGAEAPTGGLEFWVGDEERLGMEEILLEEGVAAKKSPRIVLNPGADAVYKRWPEEHFGRLADLLVQRFSAEVFIVGGPDDRSVAERVFSGMQGNAFDLVGKLTLLQLAAFLEGCDMVVSNDTGPMHLAAAVATPVVALFGPGNPRRYGPYGPEGFHRVIQGGASCSPCSRFGCRDKDCMIEITPERVLETVASRLSPQLEHCV